MICECILSDDTLSHLKNIQKILQKEQESLCISDVVVTLLKYFEFGIRDIPSTSVILIEEYLFNNSEFLFSFYEEVLLSAVFYSDS